MTIPDALRAVLPSLRCPVCAASLTAGDAQVRCGNGHAFDLARQGYLAMLTGRGVSTADTAAMVAARVEVLAGEALGGVVAVVAATAGPLAGAGLVLDLAGGTAHYLAAVLDRAPEAVGVCMDASAPALRRAARAHPRAAAVAADAWGRLPIASGAVTCALSVFGPRNAAELTRVLGPGGRIVVAAPAAEHLAELVEPLGLVHVDPRKDERQAKTFGAFTPESAQLVTYPMRLDHAAVTALVAMGPSAVHVPAERLAERLAALPNPVAATVAVQVTTYAV